jgi:hypothetical protein
MHGIFHLLSCRVLSSLHCKPERAKLSGHILGIVPRIEKRQDLFIRRVAYYQSS